MIAECAVYTREASGLTGINSVTASDDGLVRVWAVASGKVLSQMGHAGAVNYCSFTPDAKQVVTATIDTLEQMLLIGVEQLYSYAGSAANSARVQRWDSATGQPAGRPLVFDRPVSQVAFSPDRRLAVTSCSNEELPGRPSQVWVWDTITGKQVTPPLSHQGSVVHASFSLDGERVVTADPDNMRVWEVATAKAVTFPLTPRGVEHASFSPDGRRLAAGTGGRWRGMRTKKPDFGRASITPRSSSVR